MITLVLIAIAISMDSFFIAFTYGLKKLTMSFFQMLKIAFVVGMVFSFSMFLGEIALARVPNDYTEVIAGIILTVIGIVFLLSTCPLPNISIPYMNSLCFLMDILKKPIKADLDNSGKINGWEAVVLGIALSLDSIGAGIALSFLEIPIATAAISIIVITTFFLFTGVKAGMYFARFQTIEKFSFIPGCVLIIIGIYKIIF